MLTPSQLSALDLTRSISVTANAGSGKTRVLVERCVRLLLDPDIAADHIVAITFTDKAAAELKTKIAEALEERLRESPDDPHLRSIRADLGAAFVGTIHAFCGTLLRAYPLEAGVDASYTLLDSTEAMYLRSEAVAEIMRDTLDAADRSEDPRRSLFLRYGRRAIEEIVELLFRKRELAGSIAAFYARTDEEILAGWNASLDEELRDVLESVPMNVIEQLSTLRVSKASEKLQGAIKDFRSVESIRGKGSALRALLAAVLTDKGSLRADLYPKGDLSPMLGEITSTLQRLRARQDIFQFDIPETQRQQQGAAILADTRKVLAIAESSLERYREKKEDRGALDFDDLQLRAVALLEDDAVRAEVQLAHTHFLVDEFQDTNRLQFALLDRLTNGLTSGNTFIVGDPKQSIYGFRNANVEVFYDARTAITNRNGEVFGREAHTGAVLLAESFRMLPGLAAFVNHTFDVLMRNDTVGYDAIIPQRTGAPALEAHVEWMIAPDADTEPEWIAQRVLELLTSNSENVRVEEDMVSRSPEPRDIAILIRSRTALPALEHALFKQGVPYAVFGGIGFYGRQEILDLCNYLRFLVSPTDDIACVAVLRSPFYFVNDAVLFTVAQSPARADESFWSRVVAYAAEPVAPDSLREVVRLLKTHHGAAHRVTVTELLAMILQDTKWRGTITAHPQANQVRANVDKLIAVARDFQSRGFTTLFDFVELLSRIADETEREGQAEIVTDGNVVRIMTIHAAKGLEFPIVVLPFLNARRPNGPMELFDAKLGLLFSKPDTGIEGSELFAFAKDRATQLSDQEDRRLFYVACTRARDALILTSSGEPRVQSWAGQLTSALDVETPTDEWLNIPNGRIRIRTQPLTEGENLHSPLSTLHSPLTRRRLFTDAIESAPYGEYFSASHFVTWNQCPTKYVLRYMLGAPEELRPRQDPGLNGDDRIYGTARGTVTHAVLARMDHFADTDVNEIILEEITKLGYEVERADELEKSVAKIIADTRSYSKWKPLFALQPALVEYELAAAVGKEFVHGVIDRLVQAPDGAWHVIDYKTDSINKDNAEYKRSTYSLQLDVYAFLVLTQYPDAPRVETHLWFLRNPEFSLDHTYTRDDLPRLRADMDRMLHSITDTQSEGRAAFRNTEHCPSCSFARKSVGKYICQLD